MSVNGRRALVPDEPDWELVDGNVVGNLIGRRF